MNDLPQTLAKELHAVRQQGDALFAMLDPSTLYDRPIAQRHRIVFYIGHLEAFDWNTLCREALGKPSRNAEWEQLFAAGIDPVGGGLPTDNPSDWPTLKQLRPWLAELRKDVDDAVANAPLQGWLEEGWLPRLLAEHRAMHVETLCYMFQRMPAELKRGVPRLTQVPERDNAFVSIAQGTAQLGLGQRFMGWDNEYAAHSVEVPAFSIQRDAVSNADWLHFVQTGGYNERSLWSDEDWAWRKSADVSHPAFWRREGDEWRWRGMFGDTPLSLGSAVFVSQAEASAYARFVGARLPTEPEWHRALGQVNDLQRNGWEWTCTLFAPFEGFRPLPFYPGYSANFFDGLHYVMKGGSVRTAASLLRPSFRNWFQPHYPFVYAKFRVVK